MVWGVDNIIKTIYNGLNFFEPFINYYQGGGMFKRFSILWIMVASLAFSGLACGDLTQNGYQSSNSQEKSKQKKRQDEHKRPEVKYGYPESMPDKTAFFVTVHDALNQPVEDAKIRVTFYARDKFGEEHPWGPCLSNYTHWEKTDHAGNAKFVLPTVLCYNFEANIEVKKSKYHGDSKDRVEIDEGMKPIKFRIWSEKQWKNANGDCD